MRAHVTCTDCPGVCLCVCWAEHQMCVYLVMVKVEGGSFPRIDRLILGRKLHRFGGLLELAGIMAGLSVCVRTTAWAGWKWGEGPKHRHFSLICLPCSGFSQIPHQTVYMDESCYLAQQLWPGACIMHSR